MLRGAMALVILTAGMAAADTLVPTRTIPSQTILTAADVRVEKDGRPGYFSAPADVIGLEARVVLYAGRPIRAGQVGPPALVERNQIVTLVYRQGGLEIMAEGRSLGRAGLGEELRVMNLGSRSIVRGQVAADGRVIVGQRR